jgi:mevalonate kinase
MTQITCSAPGKVILAGEHAVVHGYPAIASAVTLRMSMTLDMLDEPKFELHLDDIGMAFRATSINSLALESAAKYPLFKAVLDTLQADGKGKPRSQGFTLAVKSAIPVSAGLGSSAATCACFLDILAAWFGLEMDKERLLASSRAAEKLYHSNPSGIDTAASINGGMFLFQKGQIVERIECNALPDGDLVIVDTGVQRNTGKMVDAVKEALSNDKGCIEGCFEKIAAIVDETWSLVKSGRLTTRDLGALFSRNQRELQTIGVSNPGIEDIIKAGTKNGATGGKLTGAGGGGCVILACPKIKAERVINALKKGGFNAFKADFSSEGIKCSDGVDSS